MSNEDRELPPINRTPRPVRRDHGDYNVVPDFDELGFMSILIKAGIPTSQINQAVDTICDAVSYHASPSRPLPVLKVADEREDFLELQARLAYILDSLHALAYKSRERILNLSIYSREVDPHDIERGLRELDRRVHEVLKGMPAEGTQAGRPAYNQTRNTPLLVSLMGVWFQAFPDDGGVRRNGQYAQDGSAEYRGALLDFVATIVEFFNIDHMGSRRMIGLRLMENHRQRNAEPKPLQDLIRAKVRAAEKPSNA